MNNFLEDKERFKINIPNLTEKVKEFKVSKPPHSKEINRFPRNKGKVDSFKNHQTPSKHRKVQTQFGYLEIQTVRNGLLHDLQDYHLIHIVLCCNHDPLLYCPYGDLLDWRRLRKKFQQRRFYQFGQSPQNEQFW